MVKNMKEKNLDSKYKKTNAIPSCKKPKLEFYDNAKKAVERYNELLNMPNVYSLFIDPVKGKKGYWSVEIQEYTDKWLAKYARK